MSVKLVFFSSFIFIFGIVITVLAIDQHSKISNKCVSKKVHIGFNLILMLGVMMFVIPLIQLFCYLGCECVQSDLAYKWIVVFISAFLVTTGGVVWDGLDKDPNCKLDSAKSFIMGVVLSSGILFFFLVAGPFILQGLKKIWSEKGESSGESSEVSDLGDMSKGDVKFKEFGKGSSEVSDSGDMSKEDVELKEFGKRIQ
jgi:hypothetical protein